MWGSEAALGYGTCRATETAYPGLYAAYRSLIGRTPRPRNKMMPYRTTYEMFVVEEVRPVSACPSVYARGAV